MAVHTTEIACGDGGENWREMFGPHHVDHLVRQAISMCWMALPHDRRTTETIETEIRRLVDRALRDLKEDAKAFGF